MSFFTIHKSFILRGIAVCLALFIAAGTALAQDTVKDQVFDAESKIKAEKDLEYKMRASGKTDTPIVIELFTTRDCSACIFADRMLYDAMADKQVIALSCIIKDGLKKNPVNENAPMDPCLFRQWAYKSTHVTQDVTLSLPTFMLNGYDEVGVSSLSYFHKLLEAYHYKFKNNTLEVYMEWKDKDTITIHFPQDPKVEKFNINASAWLVRYKGVHIEKINEGLNKGRVLRFSNVIQNIRHVAKWHGTVRTIDIDVPVPQGGKEKGGYVILVSAMMGESVMAAGQLEDYPLPNDLKSGVLKPQEKTAPAKKTP